MDTHTHLLFNHKISCPDGSAKYLQICQGDLCETTEYFDVLVCSAFKNSYYPSEHTLIGSLYHKKDISVKDLSTDPEIDLRHHGCWVSRPLDANFGRIACVELLDTALFHMKGNMADAITLKNTFSTLKYMLEELVKNGHYISSIALPILGSGNQGLELCYIVPPLLSQCMEALYTIPCLKKITFYEMNPDKAMVLKSMCEKALSKETPMPDIFISYSTKQQQLAYTLQKLLLQNDITCWMAPESIPAGSNYQAEIPAALSQIPIVLLILSPEAENSRWVQKEIGCTIGAKHTLIPYQFYQYEHSSQFNFLLDGEQIFEAYKYSAEERNPRLIHLLKAKLATPSKQETCNPTEANEPVHMPRCHFSRMNDYELLDYLTHCAFDPAYQDRNYILDEIRMLLSDL